VFVCMCFFAVSCVINKISKCNPDLEGSTFNPWQATVMTRTRAEIEDTGLLAQKLLRKHTDGRQDGHDR